MIDTQRQSKGGLRGAIFDMDGVLVLSEPLIAEAAIKMFAEKGYTLHPEDFRPFIGMGEDRFIGGPAELRGIKLDPSRDKAHAYAIYVDIIKGRLKPLKGAIEFLAECRQHGLALALASSADTIKIEANLREIGLPRETFASIVSGSDVQKKKPAPDIFLEASRRLNVEPAACLVIEDAVAGVAAAKAAGMKCLAVTTSFAADQLQQADWVVRNLSEASGLGLIS